jgi:hypothetical protein
MSFMFVWSNCKKNPASPVHVFQSACLRFVCSTDSTRFALVFSIRASANSCSFFLSFLLSPDTQFGQSVSDWVLWRTGIHALYLSPLKWIEGSCDVSNAPCCVLFHLLNWEGCCKYLISVLTAAHLQAHQPEFNHHTTGKRNCSFCPDGLWFCLMCDWS